MARGRRLKKGGGDLEVQKQNVASSEETVDEQNVVSSEYIIVEQNVASSNQKIIEQNVVQLKLRPEQEQNVVS
jgi:hypothetical protein